MAKRRFVNGLECRNLLSQAVQKRTPVTLTNNVDSLWRVYKSHFLSLRGNHLVLSQPIPDEADCHLEPGAGQELAVSFKKGYNKYLFLTKVIKADQYELEPGNSIPVINVYAPDHVEKVQRRVYNRADVPHDNPVTVTFRRSRADSGDTQSWQGQLSNLSAGGLAVQMKAADVPKLPDNEQVTMQFIPLPGHDEIQLEARYRHSTESTETGLSIVGFQIIGLEVSQQGQAMLRRIARVVGVYQRRLPMSKQSSRS